MNKDKLEAKQKQKAISEYNAAVQSQSACFFCFENKKMPKHLLVSLGEFSYLMIPTKPLCPGHCLIVPMDHHTTGSPSLESNVWDEIDKFMKSLTKMNYKKIVERCLWKQISYQRKEDIPSSNVFALTKVPLPWLSPILKKHFLNLDLNGQTTKK